MIMVRLSWEWSQQSSKQKINGLFYEDIDAAEYDHHKEIQDAWWWVPVETLQGSLGQEDLLQSHHGRLKCQREDKGQAIGGHQVPKEPKHLHHRSKVV